jgi:PAS domain S-box-containing protein
MKSVPVRRLVAPQVVRSLQSWLPRGRRLPDRDWSQRHRAVVAILWLDALILPATAVWLGQDFSAHLLSEVTIVVGFAVLATFGKAGRSVQSALASLGLIASSALLVHISGGYTEAHFHFFVMVALIALYQGWTPFLLALGYIVVGHGVVGVLAPDAVYNHADAWANPWLWATVHGGFVLAASVASIVAWRFNEVTRERVAVVQAHLAGIVGSSQGPIIGWTLEGVITNWNPDAERLYGYTAADTVGKPLGQWIPRDRAMEVTRSSTGCAVENGSRISTQFVSEGTARRWMWR